MSSQYTVRGELIRLEGVFRLLEVQTKKITCTNLERLLAALREVEPVLCRIYNGIVAAEIARAEREIQKIAGDTAKVSLSESELAPRYLRQMTTRLAARTRSANELRESATAQLRECRRSGALRIF